MDKLSIHCDVQVLGVRNYVDHKGVNKSVIDLYLTGVGSFQCVVSASNLNVNDIVGFTLGVYNGRLYLRPIIDNNKNLKRGGE